MTPYPCALLLLAGYSLAQAALPPLRALAKRYGFMDRPAGRKDHAQPVPLVGGLALLLAVGVPALAAVLLAGRNDLAALLPADAPLHAQGLAQRSPQLAFVLAGAFVNLLLGAIDDRRGLSPLLRLAVQFAAAALPVLAGLSVQLTDVVALDAALTIVFIVAITNAFNFIDNMNGLCLGIAFIATLNLLALALAGGEVFVAGLLLCLAGALFAVLSNNFPHARVFLGDAGSTSLGFLLACLAVAHTFALRPAGSAVPWFSLVGPALLLAVPLADLATVCVTRLKRGVHPFTAGHDHLSHRLTRSGFTRHAAVIWLWGLAMLGALPLLFFIPGEISCAVWIPGSLALLLLVVRTITRP
ncbi:MAG: undecaprenyl/decaprenyl-phosphate alpha-N-acetylglucosaminyl 1-phosphate transferase [Planctomycetes bacterium]|nr:undecaprenyl/decaprenyl-phosphate alpha-N-acetylglucosaminyl 1-phosphate transferase [Planctomycetota bacterium]